MTCRRISRRDFAKRALLGTAAALSLEERSLLAKRQPPARRRSRCVRLQGKLPWARLATWRFRASFSAAT